MPATVIAVNVREGDAVKAGDVLIRLEAMKMELPLRATHDAVVSAVYCSAGDLVQPNLPLVDLK
jgi:biotin carboxyl carrier protein